MILSTEAQNKGFKLVPDSLTCITPSQITRHIEDAHVLKGQAFSLILESKSIEALNDANDKLRSQVAHKDNEISACVLQNENCQADYRQLNKLNVKANRKIRMQKVVIYILEGLAISELGYIGIRSVIP